MFFDRSDDDAALAFPVPPPPASVQTRIRPFSFPVPAATPLTTPTTATVITRAPRAFAAPWNVPAWLPPSVEGPATFFVGAVGGVLLGVIAVIMTTFFMGVAAPCAAAEVAPHVPEMGARVLVVAKPITSASRAPHAEEAVAAVAAPAAPAVLARARAIPSRTTATNRALPKRKSDLLSAALAP